MLMRSVHASLTAPAPRGRLASADLFGQSDDDARGAAEVAEPEDALVLRHLAEEFGAVGAQAGDGVVDVVDGEHDTMQAQRVGRRALRLGADRRGGVVLRQLQPAVAVRGPHHRNVAPDAVESDGAVRPKAFDLRLAFQLHAEFDKERLGRLKVVDDDADVVHPLNRHGGSPSSLRGPSWPLVSLGRSQRHILDTRKRTEVSDLLLAVTALEYPPPNENPSARHAVAKPQ